MSATTAVKILSDDGRSLRVGGYGVIWGGKDLTGEHFTPNTDLWMDRLTATPMVLYQHGGDPQLRRTVVGRVESTKPDDIGLWVEAQLSGAKQYAAAIRKLIERGVLGWSTGSVPHLVEKTARGEITSWPVVEISLTPTPAEPRTIGVRELKALAASDPALRSIAQEAESLAGGISVKDLPDDAFAHIEPGGTKDDGGLTFPRALRHAPHHDEDGELDLDTVKSFLYAPGDASEEVLRHMLSHALAAGFMGVPEAAKDLTHSQLWKEGAATDWLLHAFKSLHMAVNVAAKQSSMENLRYDTHGGKRLHADEMTAGKSLRDEAARLVAEAEDIERGVDGAAVVQMYRTAFELIDLEVA